MALTQESFLSVLIAEGGKVKKCDLVGKFKGVIESDDPAERERNRELFKTIVNSVAYVKEIDGVRYVVVKKAYQRLMDGGVQTQPTGEAENKETNPLTDEQQRPPARSEEAESTGGDAQGDRLAVSDPDQELASSESSEDPSELLYPFQLALQRSKFPSVRLKRSLRFESQRQQEDTNGDHCPRKGDTIEPTITKSKPFALPLRVPPSSSTTTTRVEVRKLKADPDAPPSPKPVDSYKNKRRPPLVETSAIRSPNQLRRTLKSTKASEEAAKVTREPSSLVPLEQSEHQWLVKCAAGHWTQVYGLLLRDNQLAEKRDFTSGFTALHWAAKWGNGDMLVKILDLSKRGGVEVDINAKTHGGYTPLHIAALHAQEYVVAMLVGEHGADPSVRDNYGKKAYHYLHQGASGSVREMLGEPKARQQQQAQDKTAPSEKEKDEQLDLFPDLPKALQHSISRLFQPHATGHKKKHKQRPTFYSLSDDPAEEREDTGFRNRLVSDAFM